MTLEQIFALGRKLSSFLALFADCFAGRPGRELLQIYAKGQLSNLHRKTAEAFALQFNRAPRTLQRLLAGRLCWRSSAWQRYRIKDTDKGPEVWEVKWAVFWRKDENGFPTRRHCLIVARNLLTGEVKYFLANRVPGERNPVTGVSITLRWLLRVAFGRWVIESCFRQTKEELGMDHYQVRGWRCLHRHFHVTGLSHLFCARIRQEYDGSSEDKLDRLSVEQIRSVTNVWLDVMDLPPSARRERFEKELNCALRDCDAAPFHLASDRLSQPFLHPTWVDSVGVT